MPSYSFEFFPPRTPGAENLLAKSLDPLLALNPRFATVSYGAGGSTQDGTYDLVRRLAVEHGIDCGPHLSCIGRTREQLGKIARQYSDLGVNRIVALRGDKPEGYQAQPGEYTSSWELVAGFKEVADFEIAVGCYPEGHPDDLTAEDRYTYLQRKVDAGADFAISQMFFVTENFLHYREECARRRIPIPVRPGIMPIHDARQVLGFAAKCGTVITPGLRAGFEGKNAQECFAVARDLVCEQVLMLAREGVDHVHVYTLDRHELATEICIALAEMYSEQPRLAQGGSVT